MQSASDLVYSQRQGCAKFFRQIYEEEGLHGLYRVSGGGKVTVLNHLEGCLFIGSFFGCL